MEKRSTRTSLRLTRLTLFLVCVLLGTLPTPSAHAEEGGAPPAPPAEPSLPTITRVSPIDVVRGSRVVIAATGLPKDKANISILLGDIEIGPPVEPDNEGVAFIVPIVGSGKTAERVPFGPALVRLRIYQGGAWSAPIAPTNVAASFIHIKRDIRPLDLKLIRAEPAFIPLNAPNLLLIGEGMGGRVEDFVLLVDDREIKLCSTPCSDGQHAIFTSPRQLEIKGKFPADWEGSRKLGLRAGDATTESPVQARFMPKDVKEVKRIAIWWSAGLLALLLAVALLAPGSYDIDPKGVVKNSKQRFGVFLLDRSTDTYSLAIFQLLAWSGAALFAYVFLTISRVLCQGVLELADIPDNLPGILAVSGGTTVASNGIVSQKGPKGAGDVQPSIKDLISTGGIVQPERLMFLLWTLVGIGTFTFAVLRSDPTNISTLPGIPEGLLLLSGVSAAGYLGGKLTRRSGPVIEEIEVAEDNSTLTVRGRGLDPNADVEINQTRLKKDGSQLAFAAQRTNTPAEATQSVNKLAVVLDELDPGWLDEENPPQLTVTNGDGQFARWPFNFNVAPKASP